jgi:hypothetical protein
VVKLEGEERRASLLLARKAAVAERVRAPLIGCEPRVDDVDLGRIHAAGLGCQTPLTGLVLFAAAREGAVLGIRVRGVVGTTCSVHGLPVDPRSSVVLVSVGALELASGQRIVGTGQSGGSRRECAKRTPQDST